MTIDRDQLSDDNDSAVAAMVWTDWQKIDVPIGSDTHYDLAPAYLGNRLYVMWLESVQATDIEKNDQTYLRPKVARQNLDGSFSQPWDVPLTAWNQRSASPYLSQDIKGKTALRHFAGTTWVDDKANGKGPEEQAESISLLLPESFNPYLYVDEATGEEKVVRYFKMPDHTLETLIRKDGKEDGDVTSRSLTHYSTSFRWELTTSTSGFLVERNTTVNFRDTDLGLSGYESVKHSGTVTGVYDEDTTASNFTIVPEVEQQLRFNENTESGEDQLNVFSDAVKAFVDNTANEREIQYDVTFPDKFSALLTTTSTTVPQTVLAVRSISLKVTINGKVEVRSHSLFSADSKSDYLTYYSTADLSVERIYDLDLSTISDTIDLSASGFDREVAAIHFDVEWRVEILDRTETTNSDGTTTVTYSFPTGDTAIIDTTLSEDEDGNFSSMGTFSVDVGSPYESHLVFSTSNPGQRFLLIEDERYGASKKQGTHVASLYSTGIASVARPRWTPPNTAPYSR